MSFKDKTIVITGGAKGIGAGCAEVFYRQGGNVVVLDVDEEAGRQRCADLGDRAHFIECDVSRESDVEEAMGQAAVTLGGVDVLVNNAGILHYSTVTETAEEDWDRLLGVNLKGAFLCAKHAIPHMLEAGEGIVVNMSSVQAFVTQQNVAAYAASKSALIGLTRSIAVDYAPRVRSVAICPGGVDTPMNRSAFRQSPDPEQVRQETIDLHLTGRMGQPDDIGELVAFVASDKGSFINGQPIRIDGGMGIKIAGSKKD
ncbi:NAD(P)-dependent dehydrogenase, short-chain alcohol dehydrogenase family [Fodinibius roseus]|uniref:NAD(P)-dependent dehydrogenase, short-chain alcohol dehydrogenase family n=1 Tax=Fodinibius roseus TaxID=1194090 RepID=A0A1M5FM65_9BACT|nr:glucose 1-dehydrogenase [Fodinibius roseus]SHF92271.1 NAD(P)-dependent dehydrogenase, short-chain alcohol dehydrogenase family [Fodinibius roseus]